MEPPPARPFRRRRLRPQALGGFGEGERAPSAAAAGNVGLGRRVPPGRPGRAVLGLQQGVIVGRAGVGTRRGDCGSVNAVLMSFVASKSLKSLAQEGTGQKLTCRKFCPKLKRNFFTVSRPGRGCPERVWSLPPRGCSEHLHAILCRVFWGDPA